MHFTSAGVLWECQTHVANEAFPDGFPPSLPYPEGISRFAQLKRLLADSTAPSSETGWTTEFYEAWIQFVVHYSTCGLTLETDRLIAINGIAQHLARVTGDTYACGLWKAKLTSLLAWERADFLRTPLPSSWHAPSWSWASIGRPMRYHHFLEYRKCTDTRDYVSFKEIDLSAHDSGQVERVLLSLRGRLVHATLYMSTSESEISYREDNTTTSSANGNNSHYIYASLDNIEFYSPHGQPLTFMAIMGCHHDDNEIPKVAYALILEPCDDRARGDRRIYKRIGLCHLNSKTYSLYKPNESAEEHIITII
jgi:hypothetical protein